MDSLRRDPELLGNVDLAQLRPVSQKAELWPGHLIGLRSSSRHASTIATVRDRSRDVVPESDTGLEARSVAAARDWQYAEDRDAARAPTARDLALIEPLRLTWALSSARFQLVHMFGISRSSAYRLVAQLGPLGAILHARGGRGRRRWRLYLEGHGWSRWAADRWLNRHDPRRGQHGWIEWEDRNGALLQWELEPAVWGPLSRRARRAAAALLTDELQPIFRTRTGQTFEYADEAGTLRQVGPADVLEGSVGYVIARSEEEAAMLRRFGLPLLAASLVRPSRSASL